MNRLLRSSAMLAFGMTLALICPASAYGSFWGWLGELSGPGPFEGPTISYEGWCFSRDQPQKIAGRCRPDGRDANWVLGMELSVMDDKPQNYTGDTSLTAIRGLAYLPLGRWGKDTGLLRNELQQLAIGTGVGLYLISGNTAVHDPVLLPVMPLRLKIMPVEMLVYLCSGGARQNRGGSIGFLRRVSRSIEYRYGWDYTLLAPNPTDFRNGVPSGEREFLKTYAIQVDIGKWVP